MAALNSQFQKNAAIAEAYNPYLVDDDDEGEEIAIAEWSWGKKIVMVPNPWGKQVEESYDFDVTKADKLLISCLRRDILNSLPIMIYYLPIS